VVLRGFTTVKGWDLGVQGGKIYGGYQVGAAVAGEIGPLEVRAEAAYFFARGAEDISEYLPGVPEVESHLSAVLGIGHTFESSLMLEAEYLFNGAADPDDLLVSAMRVAAGHSFHMGRHILGLVASYQLIPILRGQLAWLFELSDQSSILIQPGLVLSAADEVEVIAGAMVAIGPRPAVVPPPTFVELRSEFGTYPSMLFLEFKAYF